MPDINALWRARIFSHATAALAGLFFAFGSSHASADDKITCASDHGKRNVCSVSNVLNRQVSLSREMSNGKCVRNNSWGTYAPGIWVDNGCVAEFTVSAEGASAHDSHGGNAAAAVIGIAAVAAIAAAAAKSHDNDNDQHNNRGSYNDHGYYNDDRPGYGHDYGYGGAPSFVARSCDREAESWVRDQHHGQSASLDRITEIKKKHGDWRLTAYYRFRYKHDSDTRVVNCVVDDNGRIEQFVVN